MLIADVILNAILLIILNFVPSVFARRCASRFRCAASAHSVVRLA
jgi:hypothetical protein